MLSPLFPFSFETISVLLCPLIEQIFTAFLLQGFAMNAVKLLQYVRRTKYFTEVY